ncbi:hypothetical protein [Rubellicoccus peritrichatus]|uniref:TolB protein n=1 Tax=Rubellicoccus peritrichatus TaxID=3080537 RepID=A0AAQ3QXQ3_9BACT|nr:hypothetical protein [Puniceicoccus sp. CR14]WOO43095.1 hypothetical protein RZN69_08315 [Puniceicoccus sp. CR14]
MSFKRFPILFLIALSFSFSGLSSAQNYIQGDDITHQLSRKEKAISIKSSNPSWAALAQKAFSTHGAFRLAKGENPNFTLTFNPAGPNTCQLVISSGRPAKVLFEKNVTGPSESQALLMACDLAVQKTIGIPGYFAGKIAFVGDRSGNREIWTTDLFFKNARQVTSDASKSVSPHWSPDGKKILYTGYYKTGFPDLYLINLASGQRTVFASFKGTNTGGVFSPNGSKVAMILSAKGYPELYVAGANGKKPKALTKGKAVEASPAWSPDGKQIVYTSDQMGGPQLFLINAQGGRPKHLSTRLSGYVDEPDWNPRDRNKILFTASTRLGYQIGQLDLGSGRANWITNAGDNSEAVWLNDGRHIVYVQRQGKWSGMRIHDTVTGKDRALHSASFGNAYQPAFVYP